MKNVLSIGIASLSCSVCFVIINRVFIFFFYLKFLFAYINPKIP